MGTELHRLFHNALADGTAHTGGNIVSGDTGDYMIFNMLQNRGMGIKQRACIHVDILNAQLSDLLHDHIQHEVAVTQMVMEGNGHAVL